MTGSHGVGGGVPVEAVFSTVWALLALIPTPPSRGIFLGIYFGTGHLIGTVLSFAVRFVTLAFSARVSGCLTRVLGQ